MIPRPLLNPTHFMGEPEHWDREAQGGSVGVLHTIHSNGWHQSLWKLNAEELAEIQKTGTVVLSVHGTGHPVVALQVLAEDSVEKFVDITREEILASKKLQQGSESVN